VSEKRPARLGRLDTSFPTSAADGQFAMAVFAGCLGPAWRGVPLGAGAERGPQIHRNQILVDAVSKLIERVKEGRQLGKSLASVAIYSGVRCWK